MQSISLTAVELMYDPYKNDCILPEAAFVFHKHGAFGLESETRFLLVATARNMKWLHTESMEMVVVVLAHRS
jgi:hypothetical protein